MLRVAGRIIWFLAIVCSGLTLLGCGLDALNKGYLDRNELQGFLVFDAGVLVIAWGLKYILTPKNSN